MVIDKIDIPFVRYISEQEEKLLNDLWNVFSGPYIVSPVCRDQALYIMYCDLPKKIKRHFDVRYIKNNSDAFKIEMERS